MPTLRVKYIRSPSQIPAGRNYVLVTYGGEYKQTKHSLGLTITVAQQNSKTVSELSFLTAVHTAKGIGKQEGISEIFACNSLVGVSGHTIEAAGKETGCSNTHNFAQGEPSKTT